MLTFIYFNFPKNPVGHQNYNISNFADPSDIILMFFSSLQYYKNESYSVLNHKPYLAIKAGI